MSTISPTTTTVSVSGMTCGHCVSAVTKALHAVSLGLVEEHIGHCVIGAASEPDPDLRAEAIDIKVKEAADAIGRLLR